MPHLVEVPDNLKDLGASVRAGLAAMAHAAKTVFAHVFEVGEALTEAKKLAGHGNWMRWLEAECGLSTRTAEVYMQLAAHRATIETHISQRAANLSLRGALRLIETGCSHRKPRRASSSLDSAMAWWKAAPTEERMIFVDETSLTEWLEVIPASWRNEIVNRVDGLRARATTVIDARAVH